MDHHQRPKVHCEGGGRNHSGTHTLWSLIHLATLLFGYIGTVHMLSREEGSDFHSYANVG